MFRFRVYPNFDVGHGLLFQGYSQGPEKGLTRGAARARALNSRLQEFIGL